MCSNAINNNGVGAQNVASGSAMQNDYYGDGLQNITNNYLGTRREKGYIYQVWH